LTQPLTLTINIDGAARGNPGPAAWAYVIQHDGQAILEENGPVGQATNNVAEYTALMKALAKAAELKASTVHIRSDSELLVKQMNGQYKVKNPRLRELYQEANQLARQFDRVEFSHVYREENLEADRLCNEALDGKPLQSSPSPLARSPSPLAGEGRGGGDNPAWQSAITAVEGVLNRSEGQTVAELAQRIVTQLKQRGFRPPASK
jgi:ribonuclease HI